MARWVEPTPEQYAAWQKWVEERPESIREVARKFEPWTLYQMFADDGKPLSRVTILSIAEPDPPKYPTPTMTVAIRGQFNLTMSERDVFGIPPHRLVECDLPAPGERLGAPEIRVIKLSNPDHN